MKVQHYTARIKRKTKEKKPPPTAKHSKETVSQIISKGNNDMPKDAGSWNRDPICTFLVSESNKLNSF